MKFFTLGLVAAHALSAVCAAPQPLFVSEYENDGKALTQKGGNSVYDRLREDKRFSRFVEALDRERGLRDDLQDPNKESTVFAPTNEAWERAEKQHALDENKPAISDVVKYHVACGAQISRDCLHAGALIPTDLRPKALDSRHQRIRVFKFHDAVYLNTVARVVDKEIKTDHGYIHAIDHVLVPPQNVVETLGVCPVELSTTLAAIQRARLDRELQDEKHITLFAPSNNAWKTIGYDNLRYLFSCVGQRTETDRDERETCQGRKDLKKILTFHVGTKLAYSTDLIEKKSTKIDTICGEQLEVCAISRQGDRRDEGGNKHRDVRKYNFVINHGEARVQVTDVLASNGNVFVTDNVLIPRNIKLPYDDRI